MIGKGKVKGCQDMPEGADLAIAQWELEVDARLEGSAFRSMSFFACRSAGLFIWTAKVAIHIASQHLVQGMPSKVGCTE